LSRCIITVRIPARVSNITLAQFDVLNARAAELRAQGHHVISLGQALPGFGPPPAAIRAARHALEIRDAHVYSADAGLLSLRTSLCDRLRASHGIEALPGEVIITAGANQAFMLALMTLVDSNDDVLLPSPYFVNHEMAIRAVGARPVEVPLQAAAGFAARWEDVEPHLTPRTRAVVLCSPSNPTGAVIDAADLRRIVHELARRGIVVISDETYMHFVYGMAHASAAALPQWRQNVVVISTFSKSFGMTGWRVGYLLADRAVCDEAIKIHDAMIICAPVISQVGVEAAIRESWEYPRQFHGELVARRRVLVESLDAIPSLEWTPTAGGFFAFVRVADCRNVASLSADLLERAHVVTIPGSIFGTSGEGFIRLSYGSVSQDDLREAIRRIARYFAHNTRAAGSATYSR
jgi:aspartate/methionine/tyrosine aminotransferase